MELAFPVRQTDSEHITSVSYELQRELKSEERRKMSGLGVRVGLRATLLSMVFRKMSH
jgi:uncharacterized protein YqhQ